MDAIVRALPERKRDGQPLRAYFEIMRETGLTERSGNLLGVGYLLGHRHATTTNQYVHARRRAAESVLSGQIESRFEVPTIGDRANPTQSLQCEG